MASFGGFGGFGDFSDSQEVPDGTPSRSQRTPNRQSNAARPQTKLRCIPTTVKALAAGEENLYGWAAAAYVTVLAQVVGEFTVEAGTLNGKVTDGTGVLAIRQFQENSAPVDLSEIKAGAWLRIIGTMRTGSDPYLSVAFLVKVSNLNEIAYHMVSTCNAYADLQEELGGGIRILPEVSTPLMSSSYPNQSTPKRASQPVFNLKDDISSFVQQGGSLQWGFSRSEIEDKMRSVAGASEISKAIDALLEDGLIYETSDTNHFKAV